MKRILTTLTLVMALMAICTTSAFAVSKPAKTTLTNVSAINATQINVTWKKAKGASGYQVYRDGGYIASTSAKSYTDTVGSNTTHSYKVRAYKSYKVKQKQYFNKSTGQWQTKKPAKKYRGKTRKVKITKYKYGSFSAVKSARTYCSHSWAATMQQVPYTAYHEVTYCDSEKHVKVCYECGTEYQAAKCPNCGGTSFGQRTIPHYTLICEPYTAYTSAPASRCAICGATSNHVHNWSRQTVRRTAQVTQEGYKENDHVDYDVTLDICKTCGAEQYVSFSIVE